MAVCACVCATAYAEVAKAAVEELQATTDATVHELVDGAVASTDTSFESFPGTVTALPMQSFAALGDFIPSADDPHGARSIVSLADPSQVVLGNPGELGIEADCHSDSAEIAYEVISKAEETRRIVFSPSQFLSRGVTGERLVSSKVFLEGAMLVWSADPQRDLTGLRAEFDLAVIQETDTNGTEQVFQTSMALVGEEDGAVRLDREGKFFAALGGPELLLLSGDAITAAVVAALNAQGRLHLAIVPSQALAYTYKATPDESFKLRLEVTCRAQNLPDGTGVAVLFGRSFRALAETIGAGPFDVSGDAVQDAVNIAIAETDASNQSLVSTPLCGALGFEFAFLTMSSFLLCGWRFVRRRFPS